MVAFGIIACSMPEVLADYPQRHLLATSWALCFRKIYVYHIIIFVCLRSNYECKDTSFFCFSQIFFYLSQSYLLILLKFRMWFKYGLKAQKLLAQGVWGLLAKLELFYNNVWQRMMDDILKQIKAGEVSGVQFKERILDKYDIACELVAFKATRNTRK